MPETGERYIKSIKNGFSFLKEQNLQKFCSFLRGQRVKVRACPRPWRPIAIPECVFSHFRQSAPLRGRLSLLPRLFYSCLCRFHPPKETLITSVVSIAVRISSSIFSSRFNSDFAMRSTFGFVTGCFATKIVQQSSYGWMDVS